MNSTRTRDSMICIIWHGTCHMTYAGALLLCQRGQYPGRVIQNEVGRKGPWLPLRNLLFAVDSFTGWGAGHGRLQAPCSYVRDSRNEIFPMGPG